MKVIVTPVDQHPVDGHPEPHSDHGESFTGHVLVVDARGVWLDTKSVIRRDRRAKRNQLRGHPWLTQPAPNQPFNINWTGFTVEVRPND